MSFNKEKYGKILVPMVTPFKENGELDLELAKGLIDHLITSGNADSIILSGTTGEFHTMKFNERVTLLKTAIEHVAGRIPLIAGVGCASTMETVALVKEAESLGYETVMVVAPYYTKPNQKELLEHFRVVSAAVKINIMLYNIPIFTGVNIDAETVAELAKIKNIVAIKEEAELNPKQITAFLNATPEDFIIYNGDDTMILECFAQGGAERVGGVISGASHIMGNYIRDMVDGFLAGKIQESAHKQRRLYPVLKIMGQNNRTNPVCLWKEALKLTGVDAGFPRAPLSAGSSSEIENVKKVLETFGAL